MECEVWILVFHLCQTGLSAEEDLPHVLPSVGDGIATLLTLIIMVARLFVLFCFFTALPPNQQSYYLVFSFKGFLFPGFMQSDSLVRKSHVVII